MRAHLAALQQPYIACLWLALLYFVGAKTGISLTVMPEGTAVLWIPNAAVLTALLIFLGCHYRWRLRPRTTEPG